jgi:hypothetical protein
MRQGSHAAQQKNLKPAIDFIKRSISVNLPANVFLLIDTHADSTSGCLQYTGGRTPRSANIVTVSLMRSPSMVIIYKFLKVIDAFLGKDFLAVMKMASAQGAQLKATAAATPDAMSMASEVQNKHFRSTGGLCGIFMVSCGPSMDPAKDNYLQCKRLVQQ